MLICLTIKKLQEIATQLFIKSRKLNIFLVFITQCYFAVLKDIRLNLAHYFPMKIPSKLELQQMAINNSSGIDFKGFMNLYKKCNAKAYCLRKNNNIF